MHLWIDPEIVLDGKYAYNATLDDAGIRVRATLIQHTLIAAAGRCYELSWNFEKASRGPLGTRQREAAKALKAQLDPQFRAALAAAGWAEETYGFWGKLWTRSQD